VAGAGVAVALARPHSARAPSSAGVRVLPANLGEVCGAPTSGSARFWQRSAGAPPDSGSVRVGATSVSALSLYVSDGAAGQGVLCVTNAARLGVREPIRTATVPRTGAIAHLGVVQDGPYGAVRPGVAWVSIAVSGSTRAQVFTLDGQDEQRLQDLGNGWHAFDSPYGYYIPRPGPDTLVVRAYDRQNHLLATQSTAVPQPAPSGAR
jgi:hypothetical protein